MKEEKSNIDVSGILLIIFVVITFITNKYQYRDNTVFCR